MRTNSVGESALPRTRLGTAGKVTKSARVIRDHPEIAKPPKAKTKKVTSMFSNWKPGSEGSGTTWDWRARQEALKNKGKKK